MTAGADITFVPDPTFGGRLLRDEDVLRPVLEPITADVADAAKSHAPERLGHLIDSIEPEVGVDRDGIVTGRVNAHDFKAHWWEWGTRHHPPEPYLRPAAESVVGPVSGGD